MSGHFPAGRHAPLSDTTNGPRRYRDAAQGVLAWDRELAGRYFRFLLVTEGWWGVGETGTLTVLAQISNFDWYTIHEFRPEGAQK